MMFIMQMKQATPHPSLAFLLLSELLQEGAAQIGEMQHTVRYSTLQYSAIQYNRVQRGEWPVRGVTGVITQPWGAGRYYCPVYATVVPAATGGAIVRYFGHSSPVYATVVPPLLGSLLYARYCRLSSIRYSCYSY